LGDLAWNQSEPRELRSTTESARGNHGCVLFPARRRRTSRSTSAESRKLVGAKPRQRAIKIEQAGEMPVSQDAHSSGHVQVPAFGLRATVPVVDENFVGPQQLSQRQRGRFSRIEEAEGRVGRWVRAHFKPIGRLRNPGPDGRRRSGASQFLGDGFGHHYVCVERQEHVYGFDQHEVIEGAGIGHNDHADRSALRFSSSSRIVARS
jgi:hypothetical protein